MATKPDSAAILKQLHKQFGAEIGGLGDKYVNLPRLPTGILALDLALGGGIPMGKLTIIFGPESSNKTNTVIDLIVSGQLLYPDKKAVIVDAEQAFDPDWAKRRGVDLDRLIVIHPDYAEQCVDVIEAFLYAEDVFLVALDSIAALITSNEIAKDASVAAVGGASAVGGKLVRKAVLALGQARKQNKNNHAPAFVAINQIRHKIGVMFGDPETMPGGNAWKFAASAILRLYGKNEVDPKINDAMPAYKDVSAIIKKWKFPILHVKAQYKQQMLAFNGHQPGFVDDFNTVYAYLKELDYITKVKGGYVMFDKEFKTIEAMREYLYADPKLMLEAKASIIEEMLTKGALAESPEPEASPADLDAL